MSSLGSHLRVLREQRGVPLEEIARATRVMPAYLEALEADDLAALPAPVFARGFIRSYCQVLGEAPDQALALYDRQRGDTPQAGAPASARGVRVGKPTVRARGEGRGREAVLASFVLLVVLGLALFVVTLALQTRRGSPTQRVAPVAPPIAPEPAPAAPARASAPAAPPAVAATPAPAASAAPAGPAPAGASEPINAPYRLVARTTEPTWVRVRTGDGRISEETIPAGEVRVWVSDRPFVLTVGNAGGVTLELNGRALPPLGASGAVISRLVLPPESP